MFVLVNEGSVQSEDGRHETRKGDRNKDSHNVRCYH